MKMNPVVHFEMAYEDKNRMADFYSKTFGWQTEMLGPEVGEYVVASTTERDPNTRWPMEVGRINGGFFKKPQDPVGQPPSIVISVDDIRESLKKVAEGGGKVLGEPMEIPGIGLYAGFIDTEGNRISILQPKGM